MSHILLVEDEPGAVAFIRRCMEKYASEHDLAVFAKAAEALSYAENLRNHHWGIDFVNRKAYKDRGFMGWTVSFP